MCGSAGVGKTQIAMQLSVNVQMPESIGGLNGQCVYIDTEGSFISKRLVEIANATIQMFKSKSIVLKLFVNLIKVINYV